MKEEIEEEEVVGEEAEEKRKVWKRMTCWFWLHVLMFPWPWHRRAAPEADADAGPDDAGGQQRVQQK